MGLIRSVENIQSELQKQKEEEQRRMLQERKEKLQEKVKKEDLQRYKKDLEEYLKCEFEKYFEIAGTSYLYEFYNKQRKNEMLEDFFNTIKEEVTQNGRIIEKIPFRYELTEYFSNKYNTILNKCHKEQQQQEIYNTMTDAKQLELKEDKKEIDVEKTVNTTFKIIFAIIGFPVLFLVSILFGAMEGTSKRR